MVRQWSSLRSSLEILGVQKQGVRGRKGPVLIWALPRAGPSRAALAVPTRPIGHVARNLIRRRLRAVLDGLLPAQGWDVVVGVRAGEPVPYRELAEAATAAWQSVTGADGRRARPEIE